MSEIRYSTFPRTAPPHELAERTANAFRAVEEAVSTIRLDKGLTSDAVLAKVRPHLISLGFSVESGKSDEGTIDRPVFYGENGKPSLNYQVDAYHAGMKCGLEIEAGRAFMGNAFYRDLIQAMVMVQVDHLIVAIPNAYKYKSAGRAAISRDYESACSVADAIYGHSRLRIPFSLTVLGY